MKNSKVIALMSVGIAINVLLGTIVGLIKLPIYLDAIGTIFITLLIGIRAGVIVGVLSFVLSGIMINPVLLWFCGTQVVIAVTAGLLNNKGMFDTKVRTIVSGVTIGALAAVASAPVIAYLFGGITGSGPSLVVAYLLSAGETLMNSVVLSGLTSEPVDKTLQCLLAVWLFKQIPATLFSQVESVKN